MSHKKFLLVALLVGSSVVASAYSGRLSGLDWSLKGEVVDALEIPGSGGAWAINIRARRPEVPNGTQILRIVCDHEQTVTAECALLAIGQEVRFEGWVLSNEPRTGQRLSARTLFVIPPSNARFSPVPKDRP